MPVTLEHFTFSVNFFRERAGLNFGRPGSKSHARPFFADFPLFLEQANHRLGGCLIELGAVSIGDTADVARKFNRRHLHAETEAEIWQFVLACETRGLDFSFYPAISKATRNKDAGYILELAICSVL